MLCPNCGSPRAKYDVSRKTLWGGFRIESSLTRKTDARKNFNATCPKCGYKWNDELSKSELLETLAFEKGIPVEDVKLEEASPDTSEASDEEELEETQMDDEDDEF